MRVFDMGWPQPLFADQPCDRMGILLVNVETENGLGGCGEAFGHAATRAAIDSIVAPLVVGRDAGDLQALRRPWVRPRDGHLAVPDAPGLGSDPAMLARYTKGLPTRTGPDRRR